MATSDETYLATARILIVDDQVVNVQVLTGVLRRMGCANVRSTTDGRGVVALYKMWQPDLILLDLHMPHVDGFAVLEQLSGVAPAEEYLPVLGSV